MAIICKSTKKKQFGPQITNCREFRLIKVRDLNYNLARPKRPFIDVWLFVSVNIRRSSNKQINS